MSQIFNSNSKIITTKDLKIGQLALLLDSSWKGSIVLRTYDQFVLVYSSDKANVACHDCWEDDPGFSARLLLPGESVTLSND